MAKSSRKILAKPRSKSKRVSARQQSRKQRDPYRSAITSASIISVTDTSGIITYVNDNFLRISGYSEQELIGKTHRLINSGHHDRYFWENLWNTIAQGQPWRGEIKNRKKNGQAFWVDTFIIPVTSSNGTIKEFLSIRHDITARKSAEQTLNAKNAAIETILESMTDGFFAVDSNFNFTQVNPTFSRLAELPAEKMIGKSILELFPFMEGSEALDVYRNALESGNAAIFEACNFHNPEQIFQIKVYPHPGGLFVYYRDVSAEKKSEQRLIETQELFERLSINVPGMIYNFFLDEQKGPVFPYVSAGAFPLLGITADALMNDGTLLFNIIFPEDLSSVQESIRNAFFNKQPWSYEFRISSKNGFRWISGASNPYLEKNDQNYWYGFLHDITDRKLAEQHIQERETTNRLIIENSGEGIIFGTPDGGIAAANPEACRIFQMTEEEMRAAGRDSLIDTADSQHIAAIEHLNEHGYFKGELLLQRKDGKKIIADITAKRFLDSNGDPQITIIFRDVTEKKMAEREMSRLAIIAKHTSNAVILTDIDGRITWVNDGFQRITEFSKEEVIGMKPGYFLQGKLTNKSAVKYMRQCLREGKGFKTELLNYAKSGRTYWLDIEVLPVYQEEVLTGFIAIESDITPLKHAIEEVEKTQKALKAFLDHAPMIAYMKDKVGRYTYLNKAYRKFLNGRSISHGVTDFELFNRDTASQSAARDQYVVNTYETVEFEHVLDDQHFIEYKFPLKDAQDNVFGVGGISIDITEKLEAQRIIQENEELLRNLTNNLPKGMVYKVQADETGRFRGFSYVSSGAFELLGYTPQELVDQPTIAFKCIHREYQQRFLEAIETSRTTLTDFEVEMKVTTKRGEEKWVQTRSHPKRLITGETEWSALTFDITERKNAQQELELANERFTSVSKATHDVVWDWRLDTGEVWWSENFFTSFGYDPKEIKMDVNSWINGLHPADAKNVTEEIYAVIESPENGWTGEYRFLRADGTIRYVKDRAFVIRDENGKAYRMIGSMQDITTEHEAMQKVHELNEELNAILNASTDSTFFLDRDYRIRVANRTSQEAVRRIYGRRVQEGESMLDYATDGTVEDFKRNFQKALRGEIVEIERELLYNEKMKSWTHVRYLPVYDNHHNIIGVSFNATDISRRKEAEANLIKANRLYAVTSHINSMVVHAQTLEEVYHKACAIAKDAGGFEAAWIGVMNESKTFSPVAAAGIAIEELHRVAASEPILGVTREAWRRQQTCVNNEIVEQDRVILSAQFGSCIALPVIASGRLRGVFTLYKAERMFFNVKEIDLLEEVVKNIGFCIGTIENERDRREKEVALRDSEHRFNMFMENTPVSNWITDTQGRMTYMNKAYTDTFDLPSSNILGKTVHELYPAEIADVFIRNILQVAATNEVVQTIELAPLKQGGIGEFLVYKFPMTSRLVGGVAVDLTMQRKAERALIQSLKEKDVLIKEIHHRVKNNLQLISSILFVHIAMDKHDPSNIFLNEIREKIKAIALIHERLLQTGSVDVLNIAEYLSKLLQDIEKSGSRSSLRLSIRSDIHPDMMSVDTAMYFGLIVNEIITNSLKHAFHGQSAANVVVTLKRVDKDVELIVSDDGTPLPEEVEPGKTNTFGMQLLDIFIRQLNGKIEINREAGTTYRLIFEGLQQ